MIAAMGRNRIVFVAEDEEGIFGGGSEEISEGNDD